MIQERQSQNCTIFLGLLCATIFMEAEVRAHDGGGSMILDQKTEAAPYIRPKPSLPRALSYAELNKIVSQDKSPRGGF